MAFFYSWFTQLEAVLINPPDVGTGRKEGSLCWSLPHTSAHLWPTACTCQCNFDSRSMPVLWCWKGDKVINRIKVRPSKILEPHYPLPMALLNLWQERLSSPNVNWLPPCHSVFLPCPCSLQSSYTTLSPVYHNAWHLAHIKIHTRVYIHTHTCTCGGKVKCVSSSPFLAWNIEAWGHWLKAT